MGPLCVIVRNMKDHPLLLTGALIGAVIAVGLAFMYISSPRTDVISPMDEEVIEQETEAPGTGDLVTTPAEEGTFFSGERGLDVRVNGRVVTITGPAPVLEKIDSCVVSVGWYGPGGNGLMVEWGDGMAAPTFDAAEEGASCSDEVRTHTYEKSGAYTIVVTLWHPGPADEPITDWEDSVTVTLE